MLRIRIKFTPFAAVTVVALALLATLWANGSSPSEAQQGAMHSCPQAGKWAIAVWDGDDGTDAEQAFATCGEGAVAVAYSIDPQTQGWSHYLAERPDISNLASLDSMQGVMALGGAGASAPASSNSSGRPDAMHNCPQAGKWAISVWSGPDTVGVDQALATCGVGAVAAAYYLDAQTGGWLRWFRGRPGISSLATLDNLQGIVALGSQEFTLGVDKVGEGTVTSSPAGIDCGTDCTSQSATFPSDISVVLTAAAGPGLTLLHWTGCDSVSDNSCTVKIDEDETVLATFGLAEVDVQAVREDAFIDGVPVARSWSDSDFDQVTGLPDGLNDFQEGLLGTDPSNQDTDGDGVSDGYEFFHGSDPNDSSSTPPPGGDTSGHSDDDGLTDFQESLLGTDPNNPDTDGDTFGDGDEFNGDSSPLIPGNVPPPVVPQVLVGQNVLVDVQQVIRLDATIIPAGFGPVSVEVMNHLHPAEGHDCTMSFHVTPEFADLVQDLHFWTFTGEVDLFPVDGVVVAPQGQVLSVGFTLDMMPGQSITLDERVGFTCASAGDHQIGFHKQVEPVDPRILDRNEGNNLLWVGFEPTVAGP